MGGLLNGGMLCDNLLKVDAKRQTLPKKPSDYGLKYRDIEFKSSDDIPLKGWFIEGDPEKPVCIITHPMPMTRYGFAYKQQGLFKVTKIEVEFMKTAKQLVDKMGLNVIAFDFRNHGESGKFNKGYTSIGVHEYMDVVGAIDYVENTEEIKNKNICFVSNCCGANATIIAVSRANDKFKNVKCIFAIQPVSMNILVPCMLKDKFPLFAKCDKHIDQKAKEKMGVSLDEMSPREYVKDINIPICYAQTRADPWTRPEDIQYFYDNTPENVDKKLIWIEGEGIKERFHGYNYFGDHPEQLIEFLSKYLDESVEKKKEEENEEEEEEEEEEIKVEEKKEEEE